MHLSGIKFTRIYSSPLLRAKQTIEPLGCAVQVSIEPELIELDTGEGSHICVDELFEKEPRYRYQGLNPDLRYPGGESLNEMLTRIGSWYVRTSQQWLQSDIVLISGHEGTVCGILHKLLSLNCNQYPTFIINNCDYVHVTISLEGQMRSRFVSLSSVNL